MTTPAPQSYRDVPMDQHRPAASARYVSIALGIWLFLSAFVWKHHPASQINTWVVGLLIAIIGLVALGNPRARWGNMVLAFWLAASTLLFWPAAGATFWNNLIVAALVLALSGVGGTARGASDRGV